MPTYLTHAVSSPVSGIHSIDFFEPYDIIHMLSYCDQGPYSIVFDYEYEVVNVVILLDDYVDELFHIDISQFEVVV